MFPFGPPVWIYSRWVCDSNSSLCSFKKTAVSLSPEEFLSLFLEQMAGKRLDELKMSELKSELEKISVF